MTARAGRVVARRVAWHRVAVPPWVVGARAVVLGVVVALCLAMAACFHYRRASVVPKW